MTSTKDVTRTSTCTINANTIDGVDKTTLESGTANTANLTLGAGANITIVAGSTASQTVGGVLAVGSLTLNGGSVSIDTGADTPGSIKIGSPIYVKDSDADGWPDAFDNTVSSNYFKTATASGFRRLSLMKHYLTADCAANSYDPDNPCATCYQDADGDNKANPNASIGRGVCDTANGTPGQYLALAAATDCDDTNAAIFRTVNGYLDSDGDTVGAGALATNACVGAAGTYVATGTDCSVNDNTKWQNLSGYTDADGDTYTTGGAGSICSGAALPSGYRAAANGADCNDTGVNSANVYVAIGGGWCGLDTDNDLYGDSGQVSGVATCGNNSSCSTATWGSLGEGTTAINANFAGNSSDCGNSEPNAHPFSTYYSGTGFTNQINAALDFDYNCDGVETPYFGLKDTLYSYNMAGCSATCKTTYGTLVKYKVSAVAAACGQTGYSCTANYNWYTQCFTNQWDECAMRNLTTYCSTYTQGTEACQ